MSERILIVDDDASIRETFEHHLVRLGYEVATATSAEDALRVLPEFEPALVITDIRMPGMDGIELLRQVRSSSEDVDVLVITAHEDMSTAVSAMRAGTYDYLVKPLDLDEIDLQVERCFRDRSLTPSDVAAPSPWVGTGCLILYPYKFLHPVSGPD